MANPAPAAAPAFRGSVLVTGGCGYIGSHTVVLLVSAGWHVTVVDNLCNSNAAALARVAEITGKPEAVLFEQCDLRDKAALARVFDAAAARAAAPAPAFHVVIHFAALKAVGESKEKPLEYYDNNLGGSVALLEVMKAHGCKRIIFSSSCTVYGSAAVSPLSEASPVGGGLTNAYAHSKFMMEVMLRELHDCDPSWSVVLLRYFNPVGAHESGRIGEDPRGVPNCILPYVLQTLVGRRERLTVHGGDYPTRDGTCIRDYIHVMDVAQGHIDALTWLDAEQDKARAAAPGAPPPGILDVFNFGTGNGTTVLELVHAMERAAGKPVNRVMGPRRAGDLDMAYANPEKALRVLGWKCRRSLDDICADAWRWQVSNPMGYDTPQSSSPQKA
jgi:UDP-glucose 4-epimerase